MTQENKFAIVIGFALLLVVGILVSDHLAELARGDAGTLMAIDPLEPNGGIIEYQPLIHPDPVPTVPASEMAVPAMLTGPTPVYTCPLSGSQDQLVPSYFQTSPAVQPTVDRLIWVPLTTMGPVPV